MRIDDHPIDCHLSFLFAILCHNKSIRQIRLSLKLLLILCKMRPVRVYLRPVLKLSNLRPSKGLGSHLVQSFLILQPITNSVTSYQIVSARRELVLYRMSDHLLFVLELLETVVYLQRSLKLATDHFLIFHQNSSFRLPHPLHILLI